MKETINDRVIKAFEALKADPEKIAADSGVNLATIKRILGKENKPNRTTVNAIASAMGVEGDYLWLGKGQMKAKAEEEKNPWKDEAYVNLKEERDYFKNKFTEIMDAIISGKLGKLLALRNNAGTKLRKVA